MFIWNIVPSWHEIESRITDEMGYQGGAHFRTYLNEQVPSLALNLRRVDSVRQAFDQAEWQAAHMLRQRFADLDIASIVDELLVVVRQMAMIVAGSALTGGAIGAGIGVFGAGAGTIPLGAAGAAMGLKVSGWILGMLGLASIAEFFVDGLPRIGEYYLQGIQIAWEGTHGDEGLSAFSQDSPYAISQAAHYIAIGHVEVVVLLLGAIVAYLTRGRGDARVLAQEMAASNKGARLGQWMLKHEEGLKTRPDLQVPERRNGGLGDRDSGQPNRPGGKDKEPSKGSLGTMALHNVECFKPGKLPEYKIGEFKRQLNGQEDGINWMTVEEFLEKIENPTQRNQGIAKKARQKYQETIQESIEKELRKSMDPFEAQSTAIEKARNRMSFIAALHNPDLIAGGRDIIADFGDRQVNSTIGPQWRTKIPDLKKAAESVPATLRGSTRMNVRLRKC
ncbi:DUF6861 domain-containing protein [Pseudomonas sp. Teo4]|uniref:DUF6861 domain-containing protein n=1 Tax=Pseudomonas sp. Teo4 TaxID=3064528 RepID=UPI002ABC363A|nr:polymorphic toxin type 15 domain-containing protein [Pseudomonas sp. Teo4]MDZ3993040.1 hypothetical protein [Pseudomonas sp. Teo4]